MKQREKGQMKIGLIGYGKMGHMVERVSVRHGIEIVERFEDVHPLRPEASVRRALRDVSVLVDFSVPEAVLGNIQACADLSMNLVEGTTGWHDRINEVKKIVENAGIGMVYASNFSLGVNLFYKIIRRAGEIFKPFDSYDPFIEESHHKFKKDAPSGTGLVLKKLLEEHYGEQKVPVTSVRAGYIQGIHAVSFDSAVDTIRLEHTVRNREGFAEGAILAARWVAGRKGFYEFGDVLEDII